MTETQTPPLTTADVKRRYSWGTAPHKSIPGGMYTVAAAAADFDRWLAAHDAEVSAASLRTAAMSGLFGTGAQSTLLSLADRPPETREDPRPCECGESACNGVDPEAREEVRHFAPYGTREATCGVAVPKGAAPPTTGDTGIYSVPRFTTRRAETTCSECRSRAGITDAEDREVTEKSYSDAGEITVEVLSDLLAEVGIVTPGNEGRLSKFASAIVQKVETRLPVREVTDAEVEASAKVLYDDYVSQYDVRPWETVDRRPFLDLARAALEAAR